MLVILIGRIGKALLEMFRERHESQETAFRGVLGKLSERRAEIFAGMSKCETSIQSLTFR